MLKQRVITAVILAPLVLAGLFGLTGGAFALFTGAIVLIGAWEWVNLAGYANSKLRIAGVLGMAVAMALLWYTGQVHSAWPLWVAAVGWALNLYWVVAYPEHQAQWATSARRLAMGVWVLLPCWVGFIVLRESGAVWLLFLLLLVWCADTGAYFAGRRFGKRKLAVHVSPAKSWEGVLGGMAATTLLALIFAVWLSLGVGETLVLVIITWAVSLVSVLGDLFESMLKRTRGIKDSSALLPGHGGVLDRIDSLTAAVPLFALLWLVL
ncbi:phosphatidate cytidylyltransferase [Litchfieldella xinjiangensis]|uniref:phosphatidate cytidylyltransferase n=1 Tax=Litchfieldella xinjiangensis TaxID=1166948 RepID=UPI0005BA84C2|nr:phosphatidate cytidylyltransferase [Halomonas xinjiangensis]